MQNNVLQITGNVWNGIHCSVYTALPLHGVYTLLVYTACDLIARVPKTLSTHRNTRRCRARALTDFDIRCRRHVLAMPSTHGASSQGSRHSRRSADPMWAKVNVAAAAAAAASTPITGTSICRGGLIDAEGIACCARACGECGGGHCSKRPGGAAHCCIGGIRRSGLWCSAPENVSCLVSTTTPTRLSTQNVASAFSHSSGFPLYATNPAAADRFFVVLRLTALSYACSPVKMGEVFRRSYSQNSHSAIVYYARGIDVVPSTAAFSSLPPVSSHQSSPMSLTTNPVGPARSASVQDDAAEPVILARLSNSQDARAVLERPSRFDRADGRTILWLVHTVVRHDEEGRKRQRIEAVRYALRQPTAPSKASVGAAQAGAAPEDPSQDGAHVPAATLLHRAELFIERSATAPPANGHANGARKPRIAESADHGELENHSITYEDHHTRCAHSTLLDEAPAPRGCSLHRMRLADVEKNWAPIALEHPPRLGRAHQHHSTAASDVAAVAAAERSQSRQLMASSDSQRAGRLGSMLLSYSLEPHVVLRCALHSGGCTPAYVTRAAHLWNSSINRLNGWDTVLCAQHACSGRDAAHRMVAPAWHHMLPTCCCCCCTRNWGTIGHIVVPHTTYMMGLHVASMCGTRDTRNGPLQSADVYEHPSPLALLAVITLCDAHRKASASPLGVARLAFRCLDGSCALDISRLGCATQASCRPTCRSCTRWSHSLRTPSSTSPTCFDSVPSNLPASAPARRPHGLPKPIGPERGPTE